MITMCTQNKLLGYTSLFIATVSVSTAAILITLCQSHPLTIAFWRLFISTVILTTFLGNKKLQRELLAKDLGENVKKIILAGFFLSLHFYSWVTSLRYTTISISTIVVNSSPIWVLVFSYIIFRTKFSKQQIIGTTLGISGIIIITMDNLSISFQVVNTNQTTDGLLLSLFGSFTLALYLIIGNEVREKDINNIIYVLLVNLFCTLFLLIFALITSTDLLEFSESDFILFILLAVFPSLLGHALYIYSMKFFSVNTVSLSIIGESIGASILAWILFKQEITYIVFLAAMLIFSGIYLSLKNPTTNMDQPNVEI